MLTTKPLMTFDCNQIPLSLYIHIPWCVRKCPYCDFNSHEQRDELPEKTYVKTLLEDFEQQWQSVRLRPLQSIFIGGGTPSLFAPKVISELLSGISAISGQDSDIEITMEANPGTTEQQRFSGYREAGINRLSIGVQSFDDRQLHALGRIHTAEDARQAAMGARKAGFDNINLDLMFGLPGQTLDAAMEDIEQAAALEPEHLSWYQLTIEPNTLFHHQPPSLPVDDELWDMQLAGQQRLNDLGYRQYEISAWSKPGFRCHHNLNYWTFGDYIGIGAGAHGKLSLAAGEILRYSKARQPKDYMANPHRQSENHPGPDDLVFEFMLNNLRLLDGFTVADFESRTGLKLACIEQTLQQAHDSGWLEISPERIRPTTTGLQYLNNLQALFLEDTHD